MAAVSETMLIDAVDATDRPTGAVRRNEIFTRHTNFRVVHILVFNSQGELLLQRLSRFRTRHPGYSGSSVAAYLFSGETYEAAAQRRLREELGVGPVPLQFVGKTSMDDEGCGKFIGVFVANHDGPFDFDRNHIEAVEFVPVNEIHRMQADGSRRFTPTFLRVLDFWETGI